MHVVRVCDRDLRDLLFPDDVVYMHCIKADECKIEPPDMKHLEDVIKSQEE